MSETITLAEALGEVVRLRAELNDCRRTLMATATEHEKQLANEVRRLESAVKFWSKEASAEGERADAYERENERVRMILARIVDRYDNPMFDLEKCLGDLIDEARAALEEGR